MFSSRLNTHLMPLLLCNCIRMRVTFNVVDPKACGQQLKDNENRKTETQLTSTDT